MLKDLKKSKGASIIEVVVTAVIFIIASFGLLSTISMLRPHEEGSVKKLEAAYLAQQLLDDYRGQVDARVWANAASPLALGEHANQTIGNYTINYLVTEMPGYPAGLAPRQLTMNITWQE